VTVNELLDSIRNPPLVAIPVPPKNSLLTHHFRDGLHVSSHFVFVNRPYGTPSSNCPVLSICGVTFANLPDTILVSIEANTDISGFDNVEAGLND
jgi:hypothetical protein